MSSSFERLSAPHSQPRHPSASQYRPVISLPIHPSQSIGPFILGSTIYQVLSYLRESTSQSLFPQIDIEFNAQDPRKAPLVIRPYRGIHCVFDSGGGGGVNGPGKLRCVVVDLKRNEEEQLDEAHRRDVQVEYGGKQLRVGAVGAHNTLNATYLTRGSIQQLFGPTYPARKHVMPEDGAFGTALGSSSKAKSVTQWVLSYQGLAFVFDAGSSSDLQKDAQPTSLVVYAGQDPLHPEESPWPQIPQGDETEQPGSHHDLICTKAVIRPEVGLSLHLIHPPYDAVTPTTLDLTLGITTQQDVLLDLGYPERRWSRGEKADNGLLTNGSDGDGSAADFATASPPEFWSYPALGIDLLFSSSHQGPLTKIILHSDVPGSATWSRYEHVPWSLELSGSEAAPPRQPAPAPSTSKTKSTKKEKRSGAASSGSNSSTSSDVDLVPGNATVTTATITADINTSLPELYRLLSSHSSSAPADKELMTLDRSAEAEFKSLLQLDVRTQLRGWRGLVAEVLSLPVQSASGSRDDTTSGPIEDEGVVVAWCIVSGSA